MLVEHNDLSARHSHKRSRLLDAHGRANLLKYAVVQCVDRCEGFSPRVARSIYSRPGQPSDAPPLDFVTLRPSRELRHRLPSLPMNLPTVLPHVIMALSFEQAVI